MKMTKRLRLLTAIVVVLGIFAFGYEPASAHVWRKSGCATAILSFRLAKDKDGISLGRLCLYRMWPSRTHDFDY